MNPKASSLVFIPVFVVFFSSISVNAFNITELLNKYPNLIGFNDLLSQTKLAETINHRQTITVLAIDNSSLAGIQGRAIDEIQKILSDHIILDYYDMNKLKRLPKSSSVTTLYQTTGVANGRQGFLNVTRMPGDNFVFGSAVKDSPPVAKLIKAVYAQPYNVSILQVSQPIVAPGIGEVILPPPPPPYTPPPAQPPKKAPPKSATSPSDELEEPEAPIEAPVEPPVEPPTEPPVRSPPAPSKDDVPSTPASAASRMHAGLSMGVVALMGLAFNFFPL